VPDNVASGAKGLGITYPIALDPNYSTWTNYRNRYWPAEYLIDANGIVRHAAFGEGEYDVTENLVRQLLAAAHPGVQLPAATERADTTPTGFLTPETYLGVGKVGNYGGTGAYDKGSATFAYPDRLPDDTFAYRGPWSLDYQGATSGSDQSSIALNYHATNVYLVVGGTGAVTVVRDGQTTTVPVSGPPNMRQIVAGDSDGSGHVEVRLSQGLQAFSFTYG